MAEKCLGDAQAIDHASSQCFALALGLCPLALWTGNLGAAAHHTRLLVDLSSRHGLSHWAPYGVRYRRVIALKRGNASRGPRPPDASIEEIDQSDSNLRSLTALTEIVEAFTEAGRSAEGLALLDGEIVRSSEPGCFTAELLRLGVNSCH
jgi:hypothetical protein